MAVEKRKVSSVKSFTIEVCNDIGIQIKAVIILHNTDYHKLVDTIIMSHIMTHPIVAQNTLS